MPAPSVVANSQRALRLLHRRLARYFHQVPNKRCESGSDSAIRSGCHWTPVTQFESPVHSTASITPSGRRGSNPQVASGIEDRLMVGAIDANFVRAGQFPKPRTAFNFCGMEGFRSAFIAV